MVSLVALRLVQLGKLDLEMPVASVLTELADMRLVDGAAPAQVPTLRHLLSHTAGFGNLGETADPHVRNAMAAHPIEGQLAGLQRSQFLQLLAARPLTAEPGTLFQYGFSTDLVGLMIERVSDCNLHEAMTQHLFEPAGMMQTAFRVQPADHAAMPTAFESDAAWHQFVTGFDATDGLAATADQDNFIMSGGGGLVSTLDDVARYARIIANAGEVNGHRMMDAALFNEAMTNQLGPRTPGPYNFTGGGFGFGLAGAIRNQWAPAAIPAATGEFAWSGVTGHTLFVAPGKGWFCLMLSSNTASRVIVRLEFRRAVAGL
jgi:CubicO group peptidase (beta-lactamase class C family)